MATAVTPSLDGLRGMIKREARVAGADNLDDFIDLVINELLCDYIQKNRYFQFLKINQPVTTTLNNGTYDLPENFIVFRLVRYQRTNTDFIYTLKPRTPYIDTANGLAPRWYDIAGNKIIIFPSDDIPAGDSLLLDYWEFPALLSGPDIFPIPKLVAPIKLEAIRRVLIFNNELQQAQLIKGEAVENEGRSRKP